MAKPMPRPSAARRLVARIRMPLLAVAFVAFVAGLVFGASPAVTSAILVVFVLALALYLRLGTPAGPTVDLAGPVTGRWVALNSPSTRVPSHMLHGWAQTYAVDLVCDPDDGSRPGMSWTPLARRARDFPGFGRPVRAPIAGTVVRRRDGWRDHWSRTSPPGLAYLMLESVRELIGPSGILGNHVVIEGDDGAYVALAHLRRRSLRVRRGDRVVAGQQIAECGNSGNSSEPHLHIQAMDRASVWIASALPIRIDGADPPPNGEALVVTAVDAPPSSGAGGDADPSRVPQTAGRSPRTP